MQKKELKDLPQLQLRKYSDASLEDLNASEQDLPIDYSIYNNDDINLQLSEKLVFANKVAKLGMLVNELENKLICANKDLLFLSVEKEKRSAELARVTAQALYDQLTELPNRRLFIDRFNQTLLSSLRKKTYTAMLFIDLDKFKAVNDNYGHAVGDLLLIEIAKRIKKNIRETDTVARFGGDEFAVILSNLDAVKKTATSETKSITEKIRKSIAMPITLEHDGEKFVIKPQCTVSIGASLFLYTLGEQKTILDKALALSDKALYQVKKVGGNQIWLDEVGLLSSAATKDGVKSIGRCVGNTTYSHLQTSKKLYSPILNKS